MRYKKYVFLIISAILIIFFNTSMASENSKIINDIYVNTAFKINDIYEIKSIEKINARIQPWNSLTGGCYNNYPNEEKKLQIKSTKAVLFDINCISKLGLWIRLANFKNNEDSKLGLYEIFGELVNYKETLFSGDTIENAFVVTYIRPDNAAGIAYLKFKNCVCQFNFWKKNEILYKSDLETIDQIIKTIKFIIDKSVIN